MRFSEVYHVSSNDLDGPLPEVWPASLQVLKVDHNPRLYGIISKALVLQCNSISYAGCKPGWKCTEEEKERGQWMQGPFIAGFSFASEDIDALLSYRHKLGIDGVNLLEPAVKGDSQRGMTSSHGSSWVACRSPGRSSDARFGRDQ